jgi:hypothetical protein
LLAGVSGLLGCVNAMVDPPRVVRSRAGIIAQLRVWAAWQIKLWYY